jgi:predicted DNA-binding transcriptional regulator YafY
MTLYGEDPKIAKIKAKPSIAKYFDEGMKKFLPSQIFKSKEKDGSVIFTLSYTQALEVLPFIQKWMPDLLILEPSELKDAYRKKLEEALKDD